MRLVRGLVLAAVIASEACGQRLSEPRSPEVPALTALEQLGKSVFFDQRLSLRGNQSCAACHSPEVGWTGELPPVNAASGDRAESTTIEEPLMARVDQELLALD